MIKNTEQAILATLIQLAESVISLKLSGYTHSVCGHGKQQLGPKIEEQNLPWVTE